MQSGIQIAGKSEIFSGEAIDTRKIVFVAPSGKFNLNERLCLLGALVLKRQLNYFLYLFNDG